MPDTRADQLKPDGFGKLSGKTGWNDDSHMRIHDVIIPPAAQNRDER
jgi:hypothetical protein